MTRRPWPQAALLACLVAAAVILLWPVKAAPVISTSSASGYTGPVIAVRRAGRNADFTFRPSARRSTPPPSQGPLPVLVGLVGERAYLRAPSTGAVERVAAGESLEGWTVRTVGRRHVILVGAAGEQKLELFAGSPSPQAQPATMPQPSLQPSPTLEPARSSEP